MLVTQMRLSACAAAAAALIRMIKAAAATGRRVASPGVGENGRQLGRSQVSRSQVVLTVVAVVVLAVAALTLWRRFAQVRAG